MQRDNAAYSADGYARLKGLAAINTTYGPGELNAPLICQDKRKPCQSRARKRCWRYPKSYLGFWPAKDKEVIDALPERWVTVLGCTPSVGHEISNSSR